MLAKKEAFTLLELISAVFIIALISTVASVSFNAVRSSSYDRQLFSDVIDLKMSLELYKLSEGSYPGSDQVVAGQSLMSGNGQIVFMDKVPDILNYSLLESVNSYEMEFEFLTNFGDYSKGIKCANPATISNKACFPWETVILAYNFEDEALDISENNNHGIVYNASLVSGIRGSAYSFNDSSQYVHVDNSDSLNPNHLTISAWIKWNIDPSTGSQWANIVNKWSDSQYRLQHSRYGTAFEFGVRTDLGGAFISSTTAPVQGVWYHVVGTFDGQEIKIYVNGELEGTRSRTGNLYTSTSPVSIGRRVTGDRSFNGDIDEVYIFNRALSQEEISRVMIGL